MLTKDQTKVLKYLLSLLKTSSSATTNQVRIGAGDYNFCNNTAQENLSILFTLEDLGLITLNFKGHPDEHSFCTITLLNDALNYEFYQTEDKKHAIADHAYELTMLITGSILTLIAQFIYNFCKK